MIIWGGYSYGNSSLSTGGRYDIQAQSWVPTSEGQPDGRSYHTAIWTGSEMIIWGGYGNSNFLQSGSRYYPGIDNWFQTSLLYAPTARDLHTAVWTGSYMYIWGGQLDAYNYTDTGRKYNPSDDTWGTIYPAGGAPSARGRHKAVWTGTEMIIWGGLDSTGYLNTGGKYNEDNWPNCWVPTSTLNVPTARAYFDAVWSGTDMIVWGGRNGSNYLNSGSRYNPSTNSWNATDLTTAPSARELFTAVWSGTEMIVWGGHYFDTSDHYLYDGGRYNPGINSWIDTSTDNPPIGRQNHTGIWTGSEMIIWGGYDGTASCNTGGRYDPVANVWVSTSTENAPSPRDNHSAIWTGDEMIIWGGGSSLNTGGRYIPY